MKTHDESEMPPVVLLGGGSNRVPYYIQSVPVNIHHFYLTGEIEEPEKYTEMVHALKTAEEHDTIYIYINSPGGYLTSAIQIITAMRNSAAQIITVIEGEAYSAGSLIFLAGHKLVVNPLISFMVHKYSHGVQGKGSDVTRQVKFSERYYDQIAHAIYKDVLTPAELELMLDGSDYWFTSEELVKRLKDAGRDVITSEEVEEALAAQEQALKPKKRAKKVVAET